MIGEIEVLYADDSCVVACEWRLPQTSFCQAVDDEGRIVCTYATDTITRRRLHPRRRRSFAPRVPARMQLHLAAGEIVGLGRAPVVALGAHAAAAGQHDHVRVIPTVVRPRVHYAREVIGSALEDVAWVAHTLVELWIVPTVAEGIGVDLGVAHRAVRLEVSGARDHARRAIRRARGPRGVHGAGLGRAGRACVGG